ncbi:MAG TPA: hypothetical protein VLA95_09525 [Gemmatimonadales bacterium]|nr:hypothetical protein [Gemmatimonadales bacterium]
MSRPVVALFLLAAAAPAAMRAQPVPPAAALLGRVDSGRYTSPDGGFRFTLPAGPAESPVLSDRESGAREFVVTYSDIYCRQVVIVETRGELDAAALGGWVATRVVGSMNPQLVVGLERRRDSTRLGPTEWLEWSSPGLAPCEEVTVSNRRAGDRVRPDAEAAMAVFIRPGRIYRVLYIAGRGAQGAVSNGVRRLPAGVVLRELLEGFEAGAEPGTGSR